MARTLRSDLAVLRTATGRRWKRLSARLASRSRAASARFAEDWQRSLQLRVVLLTILLGTSTLVLVGVYMHGRIVEGLTTARISAASADAAARSAAAQRTFDSADKTDDASLYRLAYAVVQGETAKDRSREVVLAPAIDGTAGPSAVPALDSGGISLAAIPEALRKAVVADPSVQRVQVVRTRVDGHDVSTVLVGSVLVLPPSAGRVEMYFAYPMTSEATALRIVTQNIAAAAVLLILLLAAITYVVTRIVVDPVRRAAHVAERLAGGELDQRMAVRGTDDIAVLGRSFNRMASSLQTQIVQLEGLSKLQQQFVSDVSHELRTPLTTVRMAADLLYDTRDEFGPAAARSTELLANELNRFEALLADLLEISRYDAGAATFDPEPADIVDVVRGVVDAAGVLADRKGSVVGVVAPGAPVIVDMERKRIERILRNLVVNAIEHGEGKPITVEVGAGPEAVAVAVRDHGIGLKPGEAALVFTRFWRADPARARTTGGTGLGLAIALEDAHLHGGWLEAWGRPGTGSCFRLTLPRVAGTTITSSPLAMRPPGSGVNTTPPARPADGVPGTALPDSVSAYAALAEQLGDPLARPTVAGPRSAVPVRDLPPLKATDR